MDFEAVVKKNKIYAGLMLAALLLILWFTTLLPLALFPWGGPLGGDLYLLLTGFVIAGGYIGITLLLWRKINMAATGGYHPDPENRLHRRFVDKLEQMAIASGLPMPRPVVTPDPDINAFAMGLSPQRSYVGVTEGALRHLAEAELEGVIGHELGHIMNRDCLVKTINIACLGLMDKMLAMAKGMMKLGAGTAAVGTAIDAADNTYYVDQYGNVSKQNAGAGLQLIGLFIIMIALGLMLNLLITRKIGSWLYFGISRRQEFAADARAVEFTRNKEGLLSAFNKIRRMDLQGVNRGAVVESMYFSSDFAKSGFGALSSTHPPLEKRMQAIMGHKFEFDAYGRIPGVDDVRVGVDRQAQMPGRTMQGQPANPNPQRGPAAGLAGRPPQGRPQTSQRAMMKDVQVKRLKCPGCTKALAFKVPEPRPARLSVRCNGCGKQGSIPL